MGACLCGSGCESVNDRGLGLPELVCGRMGKGGRVLSLDNELFDVKAVRDLGRLRFPSSASTLGASGSVVVEDVVWGRRGDFKTFGLDGSGGCSLVKSAGEP